MDSDFRLLSRTLDDLNGQLQNFGKRRDLVGVTEQYNQLRLKCSKYVDDSLLPPEVKGSIYNYQGRISQLVAQVNQLRAQLKVLSELSCRNEKRKSENEVINQDSHRKITGFLRKTWSIFNQNLIAQIVGTLLATAILAVIGYFGLRQQPKQMASPQQEISSRKKIYEQDTDAPVVRFADGKRAYINFSLVTRILPSELDKVIEYGKNAEIVKQSLEPLTISNVHAVLAGYSFDNAQKNRKAIETKLLIALRPKYKTVGITLDSISLMAFRLLRPDEQ